MKSRCYLKSMTRYERYGGRGIKVCDEWLHSFEAFLSDVGRRPSKKYTLDRIDTDGDYCRANVRWATRKQQQRNRNCNRIICLNGKSITLAEAVEMSPLPYNTILYRLKRGWTVQNALTLPRQRGIRP